MSENNKILDILKTMNYIKKRFVEEYDTQLKNLRDEIDNYKLNITEDLLKQISNEYNISEKDLTKKFIKNKMKKKKKDDEELEDLLIKNIIKNENDNNEKLEDEVKKEKKIEYKKINIDKFLKSNFPDIKKDNYYMNIETKEVIQASNKEKIGIYEDKILKIEQSFINNYNNYIQNKEKIDN